jgi:hypothetical protein
MTLLVLLACTGVDPASLGTYAGPPRVVPASPRGHADLMVLIDSLPTMSDPILDTLKASVASSDPADWTTSVTHAPLGPVLAHTGIESPIVDYDDPLPEYGRLQTLARSQVLLARRELADGDPDAATDALLDAMTLGVLLQYSGGSLVQEMVGVAVQSIVLQEIVLILGTPQGLGSAGERRLAEQLSMWNALPPATPHAVGIECGMMDALYMNPGELEVGFGYDMAKTVTIHRERCDAWVRAVSTPYPKRTSPEFDELSGGLTNFQGSTLLNMGELDYAQFASREDRLVAFRQMVVAAVALRAGVQDGMWPTVALPIDPMTGAPVAWSPPVLSTIDGGTSSSVPLEWTISLPPPPAP